MANCLRTERYLEAMSHTHRRRQTHTHSRLEGRGLNFKSVWFLAGSAGPCLQTFDDKWPCVHLKWESSQRNAVIDSFFTKRLKRTKFPPDRTADQTELSAKDIRSDNCPRCLCSQYMNNVLCGLWGLGAEVRGAALILLVVIVWCCKSLFFLLRGKNNYQGLLFQWICYKNITNIQDL